MTTSRLLIRLIGQQHTTGPKYWRRHRRSCYLSPFFQGWLEGKDIMRQFYLSFAVIFALMGIADLFGNTLVILVVLKNKSMKTPVNYMLLNLAIADILVGIFFGIQFIVTPVLDHPRGTTGDLLCKLVTGGVPGWIGAVTSIFSLVAIAIERYFAVMFPHSIKGKLTSTKVVIFVMISWFLAFLWAGVGFFIMVYNQEINACVHNWSKEIYANIYTVGWLFVAGILPLSIMGILYSRVVYRLWFTEQGNDRTQISLLRYRRRVTRLVIAVTIVYALCWIPELIIYFLGFTGAIKLTQIHFNIASALVFFNSTVNPIVYSLQSSAFRRHYWNLFFCRTNHRSNQIIPRILDSQSTTVIHLRAQKESGDTKRTVPVSEGSDYKLAEPSEMKTDS